jgi:tetratricopeptide (TPR) repeat protein
MGREQQALQSYRTAIDVLPVTVQGRDDLTFRNTAVEGYANYIAKSQSRDAELASLEEKANRTNRPTEWYVIAKTYVAMGDADNAIDAYNRALLASGSNDQAIAKYQLNPEDADVVAALRKIGVVPGPSLLEQTQLSKPILPKGPLPELEINVKDSSAGTSGQ